MVSWVGKAWRSGLHPQPGTGGTWDWWPNLDRQVYYKDPDTVPTENMKANSTYEIYEMLLYEVNFRIKRKTF